MLGDPAFAGGRTRVRPTSTRPISGTGGTSVGVAALAGRSGATCSTRASFGSRSSCHGRGIETRARLRDCTAVRKLPAILWPDRLLAGATGRSRKLATQYDAHADEPFAA